MKLRILQIFFATPVYRSTLLHVLRELNRLFRWRFVKILALSFIAAGAQVAALVMIMNTVNILASGGAIELYGVDLKLAPSVAVVFTMAGSVVGLITVATVTMFLSRAAIARLMIDFHNHLERGVFLGVARMARLQGSENTRDSPSAEDLASMIGKDGRFAGRVINEVASSAFPFAAVAIMLPMLVYLDWRLFLILGAILVSSLAVYGLVGRRGAGVSVALEQSGPAASRARMGVLKTIRSSAPGSEEVQSLVDKLRINKDVRGFETAYANRLTMPHLGNAVGSGFLAITSFVVLVYFGLQILDGAWDQSSGIMFVMLFVYTLISIRNLGRSLTNVNIFYPHLRRIIQFILENSDGEQPISPSGWPEQTTDYSDLICRIDEALGNPLGYVPFESDPDFQTASGDLSAAFQANCGLSSEEAESLLLHAALCPQGDDQWVGLLQTMALIRSPEGQERLRGFPGSEHRDQLVRYLAQTSKKGFRAELWDSLDGESRGILIALGCAGSNAPVQLLPLTPFSNLSKEQRNYLLNAFQNLTVFYSRKNTSFFNRLAVDNVLNCASGQPVLEAPGTKGGASQKPPDSGSQDDDLLNGVAY